MSSPAVLNTGFKLAPGVRNVVGVLIGGYAAWMAYRIGNGYNKRKFVWRFVLVLPIEALHN